MSRSWRLTVLLAAVVVLGGAAAWRGYEAYMRSTAGEWPIHALAEDLSDPRRLAGFAEDMFVGRVIERVNFHDLDDDLNRTSYRVLVLDVLKGGIRGTVTVNQLGGEDRFGNRWYIEGVDPLVTGATYLFASRPSGRDSLGETLTPRWGHILLDDDAERTREVAAARTAIEYQIPYPIPARPSPSA